MEIGLMDVDGHSGFPNLALMKLSAWHKAQGDSVEWCTPQMIDVVRGAVENLMKEGVPASKVFCYALLTDVEEAHRRICALRDMGVGVFAQPYINFEDGYVYPELKHLARWRNNKFVFNACSWEGYKWHT